MPLGSISGLGVGSKLDLQGVLDKLRAVDEKAVTTLNDKKTAAKTQLTAFDAVNAKLLAVKSHALTLSLNGSFLEKSVAGLEKSVASASATLSTPDASHTLEVTRLATKSSVQSAGVATADTAIAGAATTLAYSLGASPETVSVTVPAGTTLHQLATLINDDTHNPGVTASVVNTGVGNTPFRLILTAKNSGEAHRIHLSGTPPALAFTELQGANGASLNAALQVDGVSYERQSNTGLTDILQGITLDLQGTGQSSLQVSADTDTIKTAITGLVQTFQEALQEIASQTAFDQQTKTFGPLGTSSALRNARGALTALFGSTVNTGGKLSSLVDLGLSFNRDGSISLDETQLDQALKDHLQDATSLFLGKTGVTGLGTQLTDKLTELTRSTGLIASEKQATQGTISRLETHITSSKARLDRRFDTLARQFAALDRYAAKIQQQGDSLTSFITSLNNTNSK